MQTSIYKMDKQQGPTVQRRELYLLSCDKPQWKKCEKEDMRNWDTAVQQELTQHYVSTVHQ